MSLMSTPTKFQSMNKFPDPNFPLIVTEEEDGSFTLEWDDLHPITSVFNNYTEQDFIDMLTAGAIDTLQDNEELDASKQVED
jgi:hypothetical protein